MSTTATQVQANDRMLRIALKADAIASGVTGLGFVALGQMHETLYGLPTALTMPAGIFLLAYAAMVWFTSTRPQINPALVWTIIIGNAMWVVASATVTVADLVPLTGLGIAFVALQAAAVALFAELEFIGLRRASR
ncbi:MAG TPA: hypothetical protein DGG94_13295 [Micromonosporaceae bacterium]|nr:hypothetical protein [Micromonosporaceae bacterium]HCU50752.1 hypothetical protein [Micromonosporaceae bacterium]